MAWLVYLKTLKGTQEAQLWHIPSYIHSQIGTNKDGTPRFGYAAEQFICKKELADEDFNLLTLDGLVAKYPISVVHAYPVVTHKR